MRHNTPKATLNILFGCMLATTAVAGTSEPHQQTDHRPARHQEAAQSVQAAQQARRPWVGVEPLPAGTDCPADVAPGRTVNVLAIDGGGVRGIIPAAVLAYIEARANRPVAELFDLLAGVSTRSLIAVSLSKPGSDSRPAVAAWQVAEGYLNDVQHLFPRGLTFELARTNGLLLPKYRAEVLEDLLRERLGHLYLSELIGEVIVPTYDLRSNRARLFQSADARADPGRDYLVRDMLRAATAAPSIYPPKRLADRDGRETLLGVDAGLFVNNPAELAEAEARALWPSRGVTLLSLGTGVQSAPVVNLSSNFGLVDWVPGLLYVGAYGQETVATLESVRQLEEARAPDDRHGLRLSPRLSPASVSQFDASPAHMELLLRDAATLIDTERAALDQMVRLLLCAKRR